MNFLMGCGGGPGGGLSWFCSDRSRCEICTNSWLRWLWPRCGEITCPNSGRPFRAWVKRDFGVSILVMSPVEQRLIQAIKQSGKKQASGKRPNWLNQSFKSCRTFMKYGACTVYQHMVMETRLLYCHLIWASLYDPVLTNLAVDWT